MKENKQSHINSKNKLIYERVSELKTPKVVRKYFLSFCTIFLLNTYWVGPSLRFIFRESTWG